MPTSEARIAANKANAARSTGPRTSLGKSKSRENALKHGLTGDGIVLQGEDATEVERLQRNYEADLKPSSDLGRTLVRRMALMTVRMDRSEVQERANLADRVEQALADFDEEWPVVEGVKDPLRERMRGLTADRALFDPSKEATLARKYEAAAERCFFRSLNELRLVEKQAKAGQTNSVASPSGPALGSFLSGEVKRPVAARPTAEPARNVASAPAKPVQLVPVARSKPVPASLRDLEDPSKGYFEVPIAIGRAQ
jgi:hypothetical protein